MASPMEVSRRNSRFMPIERPALQPQASADSSGLSLDAETLAKALSHLESSVVDMASKQIRCDTLIRDEQQLTEERARYGQPCLAHSLHTMKLTILSWSKYSDTFPAIGEDQTKSLKAAQRARFQSQSQINEAKQESEKARDTIVRIIFATSMGRVVPGSNDTAPGPAVNNSTAHSDEVTNLKEQIESLKVEFSRSQKRHDSEMEELRRKTSLTESNFAEKLAHESSRIKKLTEMTTEQTSIKADLEKLSSNKLDKVKTEMMSEVEKQSATISQSLKTDIIDELQPRVTESIRSCLKPDLDKLSDSITARSTAQRYSLEEYSKKLQTSTIASITAEFRPELESLRSAVSTSNTANDTLKLEVSQLNESICSIADYHNQLKAPLQARDQAVQQMVTRQEKQDATIQQVNSNMSVIRNTIDDYMHVKSRGQENQKLIESCREELRTEQGSIRVQLVEMQKTCEQLSEQRASSVEPWRHQTPSTVSEAQAVPLDQRLARMDNNIRMLHSRFEIREKSETERDEAVSHEISQICDIVSQLERDVRRQAEEQDESPSAGSEAHESPGSTTLEQVVNDVEKISRDYQGQADMYAQLSDGMERLNAHVKILSDTVNGQAEKWSSLNDAVTNETRQHLDQLRSDQASTSVSLQRIEAEMVSLSDNLASLSKTSVTQDQPGHIAQVQLASPLVNGEVSGLKNDTEIQPKIEALETKVDFFDDKVKAMESTLSVYSSRFNNITTEPLVMSVIHSLQKMFPLQTLQLNHAHLSKEVSTIKQELSNLIDGKFQQQINNINQEMSNSFARQNQAKQHQGIADDKHQQLIQMLNAEHESNVKSIAEIRESIKSSAETRDAERRSSSHDAAVSEQLREHDGRINDALQRDKTFETSLQDLTTKLSLLEDKVQNDMASKIETDIEELRTGLSGIARTTKEHQSNLGNVKTDFYKAQNETHAKTKDLAKNIQDQTAKIDLLEKTAGIMSQDRTRAVEELKQEVHDFKGSVVATKESIEKEVSALKSDVETQAEDHRKLQEKVNSELPKTVRYMRDALDEVSKIDLRLEDLESQAHASVQGQNMAVKVGKTQSVAVKENVVEIPSDSDEGPIIRISKRARESVSTNGSAERPNPKKPRKQLSNDGDVEKSDRSSQPLLEVKQSDTPSSSQQTNSPSSRPKRGRPPRSKAD
ncbi:MAG: hypothetical protein Q9169_004245 [Polycauliona sp. 2 TL-2023]